MISIYSLEGDKIKCQIIFGKLNLRKIVKEKRWFSLKQFNRL